MQARVKWVEGLTFIGGVRIGTPDSDGWQLRG